MISKLVDWFNLISILFIIFLNEPELIFMHRVKCFQVLLSNTNNSI